MSFTHFTGRAAAAVREGRIGAVLCSATARTAIMNTLNEDVQTETVAMRGCFRTWKEG